MSVNSHTNLRAAADGPSAFARYRQMLREPFAEFVGVVLLILFGSGVNCQVLLSSVTGVASSPKGDYLSVALGWGAGLSLGVWVSAGISGGHINPAVTLAMATWRGFPWKKVPGYIAAQTLGGFVGAALVYANYIHAIDIFEGGVGVRTAKTAGVFGTYALDYMTDVSCFFAELLATAVLVFVIFATTDKKNAAPPPALFPLVIFVVVFGIGASLGMQTGYALNPARDFGPRLLSVAVGYSGSTVFGFRHQYWLWAPIIAPIVGAQLAAMLYDAFLYTGDDNVFNKLDLNRSDEDLVDV